MFPEIPENLDGMSAADLRSLSDALKEACKANVRTAPVELVQAALAESKRIKVLADAAARDELESELAAEPEDDDVVDDGDEVEEEEVVVEVDDPAEDPVVNDKGDPEVKASVPARRVRRGVGVQTPAGQGAGRATPSSVFARDGVSGKDAGDPFDSWHELSEAIISKASSIRRNSSEKFEVGAIKGNYGPESSLGDNPLFNLRLFDEAELTAACDPVTPTYDLACMNVARRPVFNSMRRFRPERAGVSVYPSPTLQDVTSQGQGVGIWTFEDDTDPQNHEKECATIECGTPTEFRWYGIYRCITIQNMVQMVLPELVEAYLNKLLAWYARTAEVQLLEAMGARANTITAPALGYGASVSVLTTLLNYLALYQEQQRWDAPEMDAWLPRWFLYAAKMDLARRRRTDGSFSVASDAEVNRVFTEAGVTPHFFMDTPSWAQPIPNLQVSGVLGQMPRHLDVLVAPRGKFAIMDRGELAIGVTGNGLYRDNTSNARNQFTFFNEGFEGVADMNSCPAHILSIDNLCYNGQQIDDIQIDCEGNNYAGIGS